MADILEAIDAIEAYVAEGSLSQGMVYDACRVRLIEIGEAVKNIDPNLLEQFRPFDGERFRECGIDWLTTISTLTMLWWNTWSTRNWCRFERRLSR